MLISGWPYLCFSQQMHFLLGCSFGITLSLILMPVLEEHCMYNVKDHDQFISQPLQTYGETDDYQPILNLNSKKSPVRGKYQLSRPRYYSTELNIREKLYVAVLSSANSLLSLGSALNRTLSKHADKIVFYVEGTDIPKASDSSVVTFPSKNGVVAPFYMLQHVADNFLNDYDFFFFVKDSTHVRGRKLNDFVHHISISRNVHLGKNTEADSLYCSLDGGILLSSNVLKATVEDLDWCIQHAFSDKASDNFGRCILHGTRLPCTSSIQGLQFVSHPLMEHVGLDISILKSSWTKDLKYAITLHPVLNANDHYVIHNYFCQQELIDNQHDLSKLQHKILGINPMLRNESSKNNWPIGIEPPFISRSRFDVINWVYFNETHSLFANEQSGLQLLKGLYSAEITDILHSAVNWVQEQYKDRHIFQKLLSGYKRFDPTRGTEYFLDLLFLEDASGKKTLKRINAIRPLNKVEIIPVPFVTEHSRVVLLLIINPSQAKDALRFLDEYAKNCLEKQGSTVLLLVFLFSPQDLDDAFDPVKNHVNILLYKYKSTGAKIAWLSMRTFGRIPPKFAIIDIVSKKLALDSMVLICGMSMEIHADFLNRVRMNTIQKSQVYFPVPYVQYHPSISYGQLTPPEGVEVKKNYGFFDHHSFEYAGFYLSDYLDVRKLFEDKMPLLRSDKDLRDEALYNLRWDLSDMFLKSKLHLMRAVEPDLRVRFSFGQLCEPELPNFAYNYCLENAVSRLGTKSQLASVILSQTLRDRGT